MNNFASNTISFVVGTSNTLISASDINSLNSTHGNVDLTKLTATAYAGTSKSVSGTISLLSYTESDAGLRLGCGQMYRDNMFGVTIILIATLQLQEVGMY